MADINIVLNPGVGGVTARAYQDAGTVQHPASVGEFINGGSSGAWTVQPVQKTTPFPVGAYDAGGGGTGATVVGSVSQGALMVARGTNAAASLVAVNAAANGQTLDLGCVRSTFGAQITTTGAPTAFNVTLQGSMDNANFFDIATMTSAGLFFFTDLPVRYARLKLNTLTGGTAPTVTGYLGAV